MSWPNYQNVLHNTTVAAASSGSVPTGARGISTHDDADTDASQQQQQQQQQSRMW